MLGLAMDAAQRLAEKIREVCPSAQAVARDGRAYIEIDEEEAVEAEFRVGLGITRAIVSAGGVPV